MVIVPRHRYLSQMRTSLLVDPARVREVAAEMRVKSVFPPRWRKPRSELASRQLHQLSVERGSDDESQNHEKEERDRRHHRSARSTSFPVAMRWIVHARYKKPVLAGYFLLAYDSCLVSVSTTHFSLEEEMLSQQWLEASQSQMERLKTLRKAKWKNWCWSGTKNEVARSCEFDSKLTPM